jgi:pre-mRNA-processing factor 19
MDAETDILPVRVSTTAAPRPPSASSIPALLNLFQNEWDSLALETYGLKQSLHQTRQELSTALYQHDAACRVIARLTKERDEARKALAEVSQSIGQNGQPAAEAMEGVEAEHEDGTEQVASGEGVPSEIRTAVEAYQETASAARKKRKVPEDWTTADALKEAMEAPVDEAAKARLVVPVLSTAINKFGRAKNGRKKVALHPTKDFLAAAKADKFLLLQTEGLAELFQEQVPSRTCLIQRCSANNSYSMHSISPRWPFAWPRMQGRQCLHLPSPIIHDRSHIWPDRRTCHKPGFRRERILACRQLCKGS